jgi:hypothetical protein
MPPEECAGLPRQVTRRHGDTAVSLYYRAVSSDEPGSDRTE